MAKLRRDPSQFRPPLGATPVVSALIYRPTMPQPPTKKHCPETCRVCHVGHRQTFELPLRVMRFARSSAWLVAVLLGCFFSAPRLLAAPPSSSMQEAKRRFEEGVAAYDAGRYEASRVAFAQAYALEPLAELLINLGHSELKTGRYVEGSRHIAKALRDAEIGLGERRAAERALQSAEPYVARVKIAVNTDGATIVIDGEDVGTSPMIYAWYLEPGEHRIRASKEGFRHDEQTIGISRGQAKAVNLTLAPANASRKVVTPGAPPKSLDSPLDTGVSEDGRSVVPLVVGGALGVVGIAAGVVFTLDSGKKRDDRDAKLDALQNTASANTCGQNTGNALECDEIKDLDSKSHTSQTIGIVGFAAGGAAILGGVALYFLLPPSGDSPSEARVRFTPVIGTETAGLNFSGNF